MIDIHVHLRDWNQSNKETIEHGLITAYKAGINRVFDMPNTNPPITDRSRVIERLAIASSVLRSEFKGKKMAYSLYMGVTGDVNQIKEAVNTYYELFPMVCGLKLFMGQSTGNMALVSKEEQLKVFNTLASLGYDGVVAVHAEKESLLDKTKYKEGDFESHSEARPAKAESESIKDAIECVKLSGFKGKLHIAHISAKESLLLVKEAKSDGIKISCGATPHHSLLSKSAAKDHSLYLKMNPPLRAEEDRAAIFSALLDGTIDLIESDHAPHTLEDKEKGASGIPGFSGMLLLLKALRQNGADEEHLKDLFGRNALHLFNMEEEDIFLPKDVDKRLGIIKDEYPFDSYRTIR